MAMPALYSGYSLAGPASRELRTKAALEEVVEDLEEDAGSDPDAAKRSPG